MSQVGYLVNHHLRLVEVANADPTKKNKNKILVEKDVAKFLEEIPAGSKRNACRFVDCIFTASRFESKQQRDLWIKATMEFINKEFGAANIALAILHLDERTPHLHVIFKPINPKTKKLGASHWFDGRLKMKSYQDRYYKAVSHLGFDRGDPYRRAHHKDLKTHYAEVNKSAEQAEQEAQLFHKSIKEVKATAQNITFADLLRPKKFMEKLTPMLSNVFKSGARVMRYQAYNRLEQKEERTKKLEQENEQYRQKLETLTGTPNPDWLMVEELATALPSKTGGTPKKGAGTLPVDPYLEMMPNPPKPEEIGKKVPKIK